mmetsp:Transcript_1357/g.1778  ORF Transcript_1357/g.1778 Transcript_1357/m.1778 type:complete len:84 (-) Transcript_1357:243-494(-)
MSVSHMIQSFFGMANAQLTFVAAATEMYMAAAAYPAYMYYSLLSMTPYGQALNAYLNAWTSALDPSESSHKTKTVEVDTNYID